MSSNNSELNQGLSQGDQKLLSQNSSEALPDIRRSFIPASEQFKPVTSLVHRYSYPNALRKSNKSTSNGQGNVHGNVHGNIHGNVHGNVNKGVRGKEKPSSVYVSMQDSLSYDQGLKIDSTNTAKIPKEKQQET